MGAPTVAPDRSGQTGASGDPNVLARVVTNEKHSQLNRAQRAALSWLFIGLALLSLFGAIVCGAIAVWVSGRPAPAWVGPPDSPLMPIAAVILLLGGSVLLFREHVRLDAGTSWWQTRRLDAPSRALRRAGRADWPRWMRRTYSTAKWGAWMVFGVFMVCTLWSGLRPAPAPVARVASVATWLRQNDASFTALFSLFAIPAGTDILFRWLNSKRRRAPSG